IVNRKLTVSVSMIIRSTKFAVIISTWYFRSESSTNTVITTSDSAPATAGREPEEIQNSPGQQKCRDLDRVGFGREHDDQRDDVRDDDQSQAPSAIAGDKIRGARPTTEG